MFICGYADILRGTLMEDVARIYKALSEGMRLRMLMLLMQGELCVCDIMAVLEEPQSKVSRHLAYLKHSGFVESKRVGTWMHYAVKNPPDPLLSAHIELLKKELSEIEWAKADAEKLREVQKIKLCEQPRKGSMRPGASTARKGKHVRNKGGKQ
jgi:ArsR family transcriptional regulator